MSARSLNRVMLIGNLTRDPNVRYTPSGAAIGSFGLATNRSWTPTDGGEKQERVDFHNIVAWSKLAEICGQLLHKGDKVYVEGRLQTRDWKAENGDPRRITEVVIDNMMLLSNRGKAEIEALDAEKEAHKESDKNSESPAAEPNEESITESTETTPPAEAETVEDVSDDIPF